MAKRVWFSLDNVFEEIVDDGLVDDEDRLCEYLISQLECQVRALGKDQCVIHIDEILDEEE